jgi:hypothetical protein
MSQRTVHECDCCGQSTDLRPFRLATGWQEDPSGNNDTTKHTTVDLCGICCHRELLRFLMQLDCANADTWCQDMLRGKLKGK